MSEAKFGCSSILWAAVLSSRLKGGIVDAPAAVLSCGADVGWSGPSVGLATVDLSAVRCAVGARPRRARARRMEG